MNSLIFHLWKNNFLSPSAGTNKKATDCTTSERAHQLWGYIFGKQCSHKHPIWKVSMIPQDQANITSVQSQAGELEGRGVLTSSREENSCNVSEAHLSLNWANQAYSQQSPGRASSPEAPDVVKKRWETTRSDLNGRFQRQFPSSKEDAEYSLLPALSVGQCIFLLTRTDATIWCFPNFSTTQLTENGNI